MELLRQLLSSTRIAWARLHGVNLGDACRVAASVQLERGFLGGKRGEVRIGRGCLLMQGCTLSAWGGLIEVGDDGFLGEYSVVYGHGGVRIGANALISMHCRILSSNHGVPEAGMLIRAQPDVLLPTTIGADVWLGAGVTVLGGVTIGDGCVVGAGAVVTSDLPPYSVALGVPARVIRQRPGAK